MKTTTALKMKQIHFHLPVYYPSDTQQVVLSWKWAHTICRVRTKWLIPTLVHYDESSRLQRNNRLHNGARCGNIDEIPLFSFATRVGNFIIKSEWKAARKETFYNFCLLTKSLAVTSPRPIKILAADNQNRIIRSVIKAGMKSIQVIGRSDTVKFWTWSSTTASRVGCFGTIKSSVFSTLTM